MILQKKMGYISYTLALLPPYRRYRILIKVASSGFPRPYQNDYKKLERGGAQSSSRYKGLVSGRRGGRSPRRRCDRICPDTHE
jgi:hypothetical protein